MLAWGVVALEVGAGTRLAPEMHDVLAAGASGDDVHVGEHALYLVAVVPVEGESAKFAGCGWCGYTPGVHRADSLWAGSREMAVSAGPFLYLTTTY